MIIPEQMIKPTLDSLIDLVGVDAKYKDTLIDNIIYHMKSAYADGYNDALNNLAERLKHDTTNDRQD